MYKVLLVDDEPLIVSGIKFMLDWNSCGMELVDTARNGKQALEIIEQTMPDIVVADINMPVMDGIELLQKASKLPWCPVFIMLTNLQEFSLVREAMKYRATDYLVKSQLEPEVLKKSLEKAKEECNSRRELARISQINQYIESNKAQLLEEALTAIFLYEKPSKPAINVLHEHNMLKNFAVQEFYFTQSDVTDAQGTEIFDWEKEIIRKLAKNLFSNFVITDKKPKRSGVMLYTWGINANEYENSITELFQKAKTTSEKITRVELKMLSTDLFANKSELQACREQLLHLRDYYYCRGGDLLKANVEDSLNIENLGLSGIAGRLQAELNSKNVSACGILIDKAVSKIESTDHRHSQGQWICSEIYAAAEAFFLSKGIETHFFDETNKNYSKIESFLTRDEVIAFLEVLKNEIIENLAPNASTHMDILERAKGYVQDNVDKRILLQDVANHICISPGYLSALFKKQYGRNFVDYINQTKIEQACHLIEQGEQRISEIAYMLSFDNAYYFSKVFRRYTGMTPSEYRYKTRAANAEKTDGD